MTRFILAAITVLCMQTGWLSAQEKGGKTAADLVQQFGGKIDVKLDLPYADNTNSRQMLDLYLPTKPVDAKPLPVVVFIHGGGWIGGDRRGYAHAAAILAASGKYAAVSVGYRMSSEAKWPAQIHDCKAAIRWIRAHAKDFNLDPQRIGATGASAGGHLVTLLGLTAGEKPLEGEIGSCLDQSSAVQCVINFCGPTDLSLPLMQGEAAEKDDPAVSGLVGGPLKEKAEAVKQASPIHYVKANVPPILTVHGTKDARVNYTQAELLHNALQKAGAPSQLLPITNAGHGIPIGVELVVRIQRFWDKHLRGEQVEVSTEPIKP